jgi:hypothetical protein
MIGDGQGRFCQAPKPAAFGSWDTLEPVLRCSRDASLVNGGVSASRAGW